MTPIAISTRHLLGFCLVVAVFIGCSSQRVYEQSVEFSDGVWREDQVFANTFIIQDTAQRYNLYLDVDHSAEYAYQNIYLEVGTTFPDKEATQQQLPIDLADRKGKWFGKCNSTDCTLQVVLKENVSFNVAGEYGLSFTQISRNTDLLGINALTFSIEKVQAK